VPDGAFACDLQRERMEPIEMDEHQHVTLPRATNDAFNRGRLASWRAARGRSRTSCGCGRIRLCCQRTGGRSDTTACSGPRFCIELVIRRPRCRPARGRNFPRAARGCGRALLRDAGDATARVNAEAAPIHAGDAGADLFNDAHPSRIRVRPIWNLLVVGVARVKFALDTQVVK